MCHCHAVKFVFRYKLWSAFRTIGLLVIILRSDSVKITLKLLMWALYYAILQKKIAAQKTQNLNQTSQKHKIRNIKHENVLGCLLKTQIFQ